MKPRNPSPEQPDLLADVVKLQPFPRRKQRPLNLKFDGIKTPRELRLLSEMLRGPITRERLDQVAGASNGPALMDQLRDRGLLVPCVKTKVLDRDGIWVTRGLYLLASKDAPKVARALKKAAVRGDLGTSEKATDTDESEVSHA